MDYNSKGQEILRINQVSSIKPLYEKFKRNLKSYSSVLYKVLMDIYLENLTISKNNQSFIPPEKRVKLRKSPYMAFVNEGSFVKFND